MNTILSNRFYIHKQVLLNLYELFYITGNWLAISIYGPCNVQKKCTEYVIIKHF